jgi:hypothetical protein
MRDIRFYKEQKYECVREMPYQRKDGSISALEVWRSRCAKCGEWFETMRPLGASKFQPNRRCQKHKHPGSEPKRNGAC